MFLHTPYSNTDFLSGQNKNFGEAQRPIAIRTIIGMEKSRPELEGSPSIELVEKASEIVKEGKSLAEEHRRASRLLKAEMDYTHRLLDEINRYRTGAST